VYFPLHVHSDRSLLDGLSRPHQIARRVRSIGAAGSAITDHATVASVIAFEMAMGAACKHCGHGKDRHSDGGVCLIKGENCPGYEKAALKVVRGNEFNVCRRDAREQCPDNRPYAHLCVLARSKRGWLNLVKATSASNHPDHFYYKPRLDLERLASFAGGEWVVFSGHPGSTLANLLFTDPKAAYRGRSEEEVRSFLKDGKALRKDLVDAVRHYQDLFGAANFFLEVQLIDAANLPAAGVIAKAVRWLAKETGVRAVATPDAHYATREDAADHRVLLSKYLKMNLKEAQARVDAQEDFTLGQFFKSNRYHIPSFEEMGALHTPDELANTLAVAEMCEAYEVTGPPRLPTFPTPDGSPAEDYLRKLCEGGFARKVPAGKEGEYRARLERELGVLTPIGLAPYFLIVHDICRHAQTELGCLPSPGRGSAAGCLVSYLLNIADCDPVKHGLLFERFYNAGRSSGKHVSLPDIDCDFNVGKRDDAKAYVRRKFGEEYVADIATLGSLKGKGALKEVLKAHDWGTHAERNAISKFIPDDAAISDHLQTMLEEDGEASALQWALEHNTEDLGQYCTVDDEGNLSGPLAPYFEQAMRLEGVKTTMGRHAAGVVVGAEPLANFLPLVFDKGTGRPMVGLEYVDAESVGAMKLDLLGVAILDKSSLAATIMEKGFAPE
jgi:DNA polymerase-3 subunit alpha